MNEVSPDDLREPVEGQHGGTATLAQSVPVKAVHDSHIVWEGAIHVFCFAGHSKATRAYARSSPIEGTKRRRFYAMLHLGPVQSPAEAGRVAKVAENGGQT